MHGRISKTLVLFFLSLLVAVNSYCEAVTCDEILDRLSKKNSKIHSISADFVLEKYLSLLEEELISRGNLVFKAPNKFRWEITSPEKSVISSDGMKVRIYYPEIGELEEYPVEDYKWLTEVFQDLPISSNFNSGMLKRKYKIKMNQENKDPCCYTLELKPHQVDTGAGYELVMLVLEKKGLDVKEIVFYGYDGDRMRVIFSNLKYNKEIDDGVFHQERTKEVKK